MISLFTIMAFASLAQAKPAVQKPTLEWPNAVSKANSDPWLAVHHNEIAVMKPKLLVINFTNGLSEQAGRAKVDKLIGAIRESSRYHGTEDKDAKPFLEYQVVKYVDLADKEPVQTPDGNSTKYPRRTPLHDGINFKYGDLYSKEFAKYYGFPGPSRNLTYLSLAQLVAQGEVNEVWFLAKQGNAGAPLESIEPKQAYDANFKKIVDKHLDGGNGAADDQPFIGRSLRILFINAERGVGCAMESLGHSFEGMARCGAIPYLKKYFEEYAGFDLDKRFGLPFDSLYGRDGVEMDYPSPNSIKFVWKGKQIVKTDYIPVANNVHFMPNGRKDYDLENPQPMLTTMNHFRMFDGQGGKDTVTLYTTNLIDQFKTVADDCMGRWVVYWRQNMPGLMNRSLDDQRKPMRNWFVFLFY